MKTITIILRGELDMELTKIGLKPGMKVNGAYNDKNECVYFSHRDQGFINNCVVWKDNYSIVDPNHTTKEQFIQLFKNNLPKDCPVSHIEDNGVRIPHSDGDVYFKIGAILSGMNCSYYDSLDQDKQLEINDELVDIFAEKYNMEW